MHSHWLSFLSWFSLIASLHDLRVLQFSSQLAHHNNPQVACPTEKDSALKHGSAFVPDCIELFMYGMVKAHTMEDHISSLNGHGYIQVTGISGTLTNGESQPRTSDNANVALFTNVLKHTRNRWQFGVQKLTPVLTQLAYIFQGPSVDTT